MGNFKRRAVADRFWEKVDKNGPTPDFKPKLGPCWLWTGALYKNGYGQFAIALGLNKYHPRCAHRIAYTLVKGEIPDELELDHLCRVHACVNPEHLEPVTRLNNLLRGFTQIARNSNKTSCNHGHSYSVENTRITTRGSRRCKTCDYNRNAKLPLITEQPRFQPKEDKCLTTP